MRKKILIVDDDAAITKVIKLNLEYTGEYEVLTENSAPLAVTTVMDFKPDLIFLDIMMPEMSGNDIAMELRENDQSATVPIVFLTGIISKEDIDRLGSIIGGNRFLAKPVKTEDLFKVIREILG